MRIVRRLIWQRRGRYNRRLTGIVPTLGRPFSNGANMTLIAGIKSEGGLILAADTEEQIPNALRTSGEKIHFINSPISQVSSCVSWSGKR